MMNISCLSKKDSKKENQELNGKRKVSKAENLGDETCLVSYLSFESKLLSVSVLVVSKKKIPLTMQWKSLLFCKKFPFLLVMEKEKKIGIRYRTFTVCCLNKAAEKNISYSHNFDAFYSSIIHDIVYSNIWDRWYWEDT